MAEVRNTGKTEPVAKNLEISTTQANKSKHPNNVGQLSSVKNDDHKLEAFSLPESEGPPQDSNRLKRVSSFTADPQSIFKEERIRLHKTSQEIELEEEEIAQLVEQELKAVEEKKKKKWMYFIEMIAAKADVFATAHTMPKHQVCIYVAFAMIPMSILTITWDLIATWVFQIPHLSTISAPGFILVINFVAMPLAMYGYMMEYLMYENSREAILGMICVVVHPILFLARAFMEYYFDGFRNGMKLYFENPAAGEPLEYPSSVLNSEGPLELIV